MKVKKLIELLQKQDPEVDVLVASDGEGNSFDFLHEVVGRLKYCRANYEISLFSPEEIGDSISQEDYDKLKPCVVLFP